MKIFLIIVGVLVVLIALLMSLSATLTLIYDGGWHTSVQAVSYTHLTLPTILRV